MENFEGNVEVNSVVDLELDVREEPTDPVAELPRAGTLDNGVDPILEGSTEAMVVGLRTDADACHADAPVGGHAVKRFEPSRGPTAVQPSQASVAVACHAGVEQPVSYPIGHPYFGRQVTVSGAMLVDPSRTRKRVGAFRGLALASPVR